MFRQAVHSVVGLVGWVKSVFANNFYNARLQRFFPLLCSVFYFLLNSIYVYLFLLICVRYFCLLFVLKRWGEGRVTFILECVYLLACFAIGLSFFLYIAQWLLSSRCLLV